MFLSVLQRSLVSVWFRMVSAIHSRPPDRVAKMGSRDFQF